MKLSIIIPAYNEEKRIGPTLQSYSNYFNSKVSQYFDYDILVVINNTNDRTEEIVKKMQSVDRKVGYINLARGGKGYAIIEGFKECVKRSSNFIGFVDADMATAPDQFYKLFIASRSYDGAIADRYLSDSIIIPKPTLPRLFAKRLFNFWIRSSLLLPYGDTQCGAKIFKKHVIERILPKMTMSHWAFDVELLYLAHSEHYFILPVPTIWRDKEYSKINFWRAGPLMSFGVLRLRLIHSPFKDIVRAYDLIVKAVKS